MYDDQDDDDGEPRRRFIGVKFRADGAHPDMGTVTATALLDARHDLGPGYDLVLEEIVGAADQFICHLGAEHIMALEDADEAVSEEQAWAYLSRRDGTEGPDWDDPLIGEHSEAMPDVPSSKRLMSLVNRDLRKVFPGLNLIDLENQVIRFPEQQLMFFKLMWQ